MESVLSYWKSELFQKRALQKMLFYVPTKETLFSLSDFADKLD